MEVIGLLYYEDIFSTIQGESSTVGYPTTFIRLYGCNLDCIYCDAPQDDKRKNRISVERVIKEVRRLGNEYVCITGGEPLLQDEVYPIIYELVGEGYDVSIETNGSVSIPDYNYQRSFRYVMDMKCPSSRMQHKNDYNNLEKLHCKDELKFVIKDRADYDFMRSVLRKYHTNAQILVSPMFNKNGNQVIGEKLAKWVLQDSLDVRVQVQIHKILGVS